MYTPFNHKRARKESLVNSLRRENKALQKIIADLLKTNLMLKEQLNERSQGGAGAEVSALPADYAPDSPTDETARGGMPEPEGERAKVESGAEETTE